MKASIYLNYTTRSLFRGGQRTILAVFCIAVGVMAIVALQSVGEMINNSFTSNIRDANGGDIAISSYSSDIRQSDLVFLDTLKSEGTISNYTPVISLTGSVGLAETFKEHFTVQVVDPNSYPVATPPTFNNPGGGSIASLLNDNHVIVDQGFVDQYHKKVGDTFDVHLSTGSQGAITLHARVAGIVNNDGVLERSKDTMLLSMSGFRAAAPNIVSRYDSVYVSTDSQAHTDQAHNAIQHQFPLESVQTASDALKSEQAQVDLIKKFLEIAGLLALLIGGVGIVNTMQVLLSRRKIEIAMLKTVGYRRFDLYLLFGLEAALLGIIGGIVGAVAATGLSWLVLKLMVQLFQLSIGFVLDPLIIGGGVLIGFCTALIFGLLPIVQAANIRPLNVIREQVGGRRIGSIFLTIALLIVLSILFCLMSIFILNDVILGISAVYGTFAFLGLLSLFFVLVIWLISILPVPERFNPGYLALVISGIVVSALITLVLPAFGILLLFVSLMGIVVVLLPRTWKANVKMALRNIGRQRARTTTTLLALFVGVFTIGLILVLGQNLRDQINNTLANSLTFNVVGIARGHDVTTLHNELGTLPGLTHTEERPYSQVAPISLDGQPLRQALTAKPKQSSPYTLPNSVVVVLLSSIEGYDVAHNHLPDTNTFVITNGRNLNASDAGTDNVLVNSSLYTLNPLKGQLKIGSKIAIARMDGKGFKVVTVVGTYQSGLSSDYGSIFSPINTVTALSPAGENISVFYMKIDPNQVDKTISAIGKEIPNVAVDNFANIGDVINSIIGNILWVLTAIASLSLLAGVIIIANAVALAMLERRRELGILKSVGYTSRNVLGEVLVENGVVGGIGALLAMLLVTLVTSILGQFVFKSSFGVSWYIAIGLIVGVALLAIITATLVAWGAVRVRPLEVLRYE